jgi:hypothetical protein
MKKVATAIASVALLAGLAGPAAAAVPQTPQAGRGTAIEARDQRECFHHRRSERWDHRRGHSRWCTDEKRPQHDGKGSSLF